MQRARLDAECWFCREKHCFLFVTGTFSDKGFFLQDSVEPAAQGAISAMQTDGAVAQHHQQLALSIPTGVSLKIDVHVQFV